MKRACLCLLFTLVSLMLRAQCNSPDFSISNADALCRNSPVRLTNVTPGEHTYYWDFCPENFEDEPGNQSAPVTGFGQGYGYKVVKEGDNWYGFLISRLLDRLYRLDFGSDPLNTPSITDLGNPGSLMDAPEGIDLYKVDGEWFAFIGKGENSVGEVVKLSFGADLTNTPAATGYGTFGLGSVRIRDLVVTRDNDDVILVLLVYNSASLNRVNFGNSLHNAPGANSLVSIPGATLPRGIAFATDCSPLRAHVVCENGTVQQLYFGDGILGGLSVEGSFAFSSVIQPWKIKTVFSGGKYFGVISNNNRKYSVVNFNDLSLVDPPEEVLNTNDVRYIGIDVIKYDGKTVIQGGGGGSSLLTAFYQSDCQLEQDYSNDENPPPFTYQVAGDRQIDLFAIDNEGRMMYTSKPVSVQDLQATDLQIEYDGVCLDNETNFSNVGGESFLSWNWDFGNGQSSDVQNPVTTYSMTGSYSVSLSALTDNACYAYERIEVNIYSKPVASFSPPVSLLCTNNEFNFETATPDIYDGNLSYQWFVDNNPVSTGRDLNYTFTTTGPKDIKLITAIPGCSDEITQTTSQVEEGPVVNFSFEGICEDDVFNFRNEITDPVEDYLWDFGDGVTSDQPNVTHTFSGHGDHPISLTATNPIGCENVVTKVISVHSKPIVDFSADGPPNACTGTLTHFQNQTTNPDARQITGWLWSFDDPGSPEPETVSEPEHIFENAGTYSVSLTATTAEGCTGIAEKEIVIHATPSTAFTRSASCLNVPTLFTGPSDPAITSHYWEIGTSYYLTASPTHTFKSSGSHPLYVEVTADNGCVASHSESISVPVPLNADFSVLKNCVGQEAVFTDITSGADPVASTSWSVNGVPSASGSPLAYTFTVEGDNDVTLTVVSDAGCTYVKSKTVEIVPPPVAGFSSAPQTGAYPLDVDFTNTSGLATHYLWEFLDGSGTTTTETSPSYAFIGEGSFDVRLTAYNAQGCSSLYEEQITTVAPLPDVHIETITLVPVPDGSHKLVVTLNNRGNTILRDLVLDIDVAGKLALRGILNDAIAPGAQHNFVFSGGIVNAGMLRYLCASVTLQNDVNPEGNRLCREFEDQLFVFPAYPNPATEVLNVEWISESANPVRVSLSDAIGRRLFSSDMPNSPGLNHYTISLEGISNGLYFLVIEDGSSEMNQRIVVSDKP